MASLAPSTAFLTVSITGQDYNKPSPGNTDPSIALLLADSVREAWIHTLSIDPRRQQLAKRSQYYVTQSMRMRTGGKKPWWSVAGDSVAADEMTYECQKELGSPKEVDYAQIEWSELGADSDKVHLVPGVMKRLSSNTCNVAISAAIAMTLSWAQVRTALDTLLNMCVRHPLVPARGGRAYYRQQPQQLSGSRKRQEEILTGLNALSNGVNITIAAHLR